MYLNGYHLVYQATYCEFRAMLGLVFAAYHQRIVAHYSMLLESKNQRVDWYQQNLVDNGFQQCAVIVNFKVLDHFRRSSLFCFVKW